MLAITLALCAGCGCPCPEPATPQRVAPTEQARRTIPNVSIKQQCADTPVEPSEPEVEILGDFGVVRLSADAFVDLSRDQRKLAYELTDAIRAADPIVYDQRDPQGLLVKALAEELALHLDVVPADLRPKVEGFVRLVFAHKGPRDATTSGRVSFGITPEELGTATVAAWKGGAKFDGVVTEPALRAWLGKLHPVLFDERVPTRAPRTVPAARRYAKQISAVVGALRRARTYAEPAQQRVLDLQILALESNTESALTAYQAAWAADTFPVDLALGFFGPVLGPSGERELVAHLFLSDPKASAELQAPFNTIRSALATSSTLRPVVETPLGLSSRPASPPVLRLPATGPAKMLVAPAAASAVSGVVGAALARAFLLDPTHEADVRRCVGPSQRTLQLARAAAAAPSSPAVPAVIARIHAEAVVLASPRTFSARGLLSDDACAAMLGETYLMEYLFELGGLASGLADAPEALRARALVVSYAIERGAAKEVVRDGHSYLQTSGPEPWARAMGDLRDETRAILDQGDGARAGKLLARQDVASGERWARGARGRLQSLGLPRVIVWQPPLLQPIRTEEGKVEDVTLEEGLSWIEASLHMAGRAKGED
jgi:hypothetical protein